jgi:hypothetical protein
MIDLFDRLIGDDSRLDQYFDDTNWGQLLFALLVVSSYIFLSSRGVHNPGITTMLPDESGAIQRSLEMGMDGTIFINDFMKGGNFHIHILQFVFGVYFLYTIFFADFEAIVQQAQMVQASDIIPWYGPPDIQRALFDLLLIGRITSIFFGILTLFVVYRLSNLLFKKHVAYVSTALLSVNLGFVNISRYSTEDTLSIFLVTLSLFYICKLSLTKDHTNLLIASAVGGLAVSAKANTGLISLILIVAFAEYFYDKSNRTNAYNAGLSILQNLFVATVAYITTTPSVLIYPHKWWIDVITEFTSRSSTISQWDYGWIGYISISNNYLSYPVFLAAIAGFAYLCWIGFKKRKFSASLYIVLWTLVVFSVIGSWSRVSLWYIGPLLPIYCILAGVFVSNLSKICHIKNASRTAVVTIILFSTIYSGVSMAAFENDSRVDSSVWLNNHLTDGDVVDMHSTHHYLPRPPRYSDSNYVYVYPEGKMSNKIHTAEMRIEQSIPDYVILSSAHYERFSSNPQSREATFFNDLLNGNSSYEVRAKFGNQQKYDFVVADQQIISFNPKLTGSNPEIIILQRRENSEDV